MLGMSKMRFSERNLHLLFFLFYVGEIETEKRKKKENGKGQKTYKNSVCLRWSSKMWKIKKWIFFLQKLPDTICVRKGEKRSFLCTLSVLAKTFFGPKQCKPGNTIKIVVSAEIAQNQKWHLFWKKVFFDIGEKVGFTNCVFEKLCYFIVFSEKHSSCNTNTAHKQKTENWWNIVGCFWTWQKGVFCLFLFFRL